MYEPQPIELRRGEIPEVPDWKAVSEVRAYGSLGNPELQFAREALTNQVHQVPVIHMDAEAKESLDPRFE